MRVGVLGGGQLGRMLALAGYPLGLRFRFLDPAPEAPVEELAQRIAAGLDDPAELERFTTGLDVLTYEFENVPVELARRLEQSVPVYPPPLALEASQDRLTEKNLFLKQGIPTTSFVPVDSASDLEKKLAEWHWPAILKTRRFGYDGKGQRLVHSVAEAIAAWREMGSAPAILEQFVHFDRELSQISVRRRDGKVRHYPLVENFHRGGILRRSFAPAGNLSANLTHQACDYSERLLAALGYVGVLAIEFFETNGRLLANEMAPRVHNSGHWTIEGARTSQFENHLRAILDWPLGETSALGPCAMVNLIGMAPNPAAILAVPDVHLHLYGKKPRAGRKLGHVTVCGETPQLVGERVAEMEALVAPLSAH
jgi:5-(carboxyamino)imidazole ribonucleotide synthase